MCILSGLSAARVRAYTQKVTALGSELPNQQFPDVTATSSQTQEGYTVSAYITTRPTEVISTTTHVPSQIRLYRFGNGATAPYDTRVYVQFGSFPTDWTAGETLRVTITNNNVAPAKSDFYDLVIPNNLTSALTITEPQVFDLWSTEPNTPPSIDLPDNISLYQNEPTTIDFATYITDPDANVLTLSVTGCNNINVQILGLSVILAAQQNWIGSETITFTVDDGVEERRSRATASDVVTVIVTNPLLVDFTTDSQFNNNAVAGDPLTALSFSATANLPITSYAWDFDNDGTTDSTLPAPSFTYPDSGLVSVKLTASDGVHVTTVIKQDYIHVHPGVVVPPAVVDQNIVWTEEGGPYNLTGEVLLNPGYSLTIEPNAQVNLLVDNQLVINGSINASEANFTAYGENGWAGIVLGSTAGNSVISGITVLGAATGFTINECNPVLSGITMVGAENLRTPGNAVIINGASAPVIHNIDISNFANGIKANNPGLTSANLNFSSVRINRGTATPSAGDTGIEINGNYVVEIDSALVVDYNQGVKIDSSNSNRARAKLTNVRVIKTESNNRNNSIAFNLQNLNLVELVRDSLSGFETGILIGNPNIAQSSLVVRNCHISRVMAQYGMETGIKLLGNSNGTIDSIYVANYNKAIELNGNHSVHVYGSRFENCGTLLYDTQNNANHSIKGSIAYRNGQYSGSYNHAAFSLSGATGLTVDNNTIYAYPYLLAASNASSANFSHNIAWSNNPATTSIALSGGSSLNASYNDIALPQGVYPGQGNINSIPMFENPSQGNYALNVYSPCIDAGNPANPLDPDGSICDMGAITFDWTTAPLIADFYTDVTSGQKPLAVQFTDHSTRNTISWQWDFDGDGIIDSTIQNPTFVYNNQGVYGVSLVVFDGLRHSTKYVPNLITALNSLPHVVQTIENINVAEDFEPITIDLSEHFADVNGDPISYSVSQNNGTVALNLEGSVLSISSIADLYGTTVVTVSATEATFRDSKKANYNIGSKSAGVYSREDSRASISFSVIVSPVNDAPTISLLPSYEFDEDESMVLDLSACVSDIDSQNLMVSVSETENLVCQVNGLMLNISALPNWFGNEQITVTVSDTRNRLSVSASTNIIVHPVNDAPTISLLPSYEFDEDESMVLDLSACVSDIDSQNLMVSVSETENLVCQVNGLMLNISALPNWLGSEQITVTVSDTRNRLSVSASTNIIVHSVNDAPIIISYSPAQSVIEVLAGTTIEFAVTATDVDSDLGYEWLIGGSQMPGTAADYSHQFSTAGTHAVVARISDENVQIEQEWSVLVSVINYDPLEVPAVSGLNGCYPNPCAVNATIKLGLSATDMVDVSIYNSKGQFVTRLVNDSLKPGMHSINWDTCDNSGNRVSNGIYFVKARTSSKVYTEKLIVLK
jgi:PKD repeat protein